MQTSRRNLIHAPAAGGAAAVAGRAAAAPAEEPAQMDGGPASISLLRAAVDAVAGRVPVVLDSGVRRGIDIFRALSLGATAVGIGRPALWGLITGGSQGVKSVYAQLAFELKSAMLFSGIAKVTDLTRDNVVLPKA